jgi:hypothetical protein
MRQVLPVVPAKHNKSSQIYLGPKKIVPDISRPKKIRHYFDALNEREIGR